MSFQVNDKVVCVDDENMKLQTEPSSLPVNGSVYVVRSLSKCCGNAIRLVGINHSEKLFICAKCGDLSVREGGFQAYRFRKLTDIQAENKQSASNPNAGVVQAHPKGRW